MRKIFIILFQVTLLTQGYAQRENARYNERAKEIQKEIWQDTSAAFRVKQIPVEFNDESAIIIAESYEIVNSATAKFKRNLGEFQRINYVVTLRQRIKINDKIALENYSSIEYIKKQDAGFSYIFSRIKNEIATYIGVKVIKPDGREIIINTNEEVLTKNENKNKEAKLAISGLEVGDILDYYIKSEVIIETTKSKIGPFTFFLNGDYPILFYSLRLQLDGESGVKYINANGAPPLKESRNEAGDIILELSQTDIPKYKNILFTSPLRQYPYIKLQFQIAVKGYDFNTDFSRGEVKQSYHTRDIVNQLIKRINGSIKIGKYYPLTVTQNYFGGTDKMKLISKDSIVKVLYNAWRYHIVSTLLKDEKFMPEEIKYSYAENLVNAVYFSKLLTLLDIDNTIYLVCSRKSGTIQNTLNISDLNALVKVKGDKYYWLAFDDIVTQFHEIPVRFQGEQAITLQPVKNSGMVNYTAGQDKIPLTIPAYNSISEELAVHFNLSKMDELQINRSCRQTGGLRHDTQKELLLTEDIEKNMATTLLLKYKLEELVSDERKSQLSAVFNSERSNIKSNFEEDINNCLNTKAKSLISYEILNPGLYNYGLPFEYRSTFILENFVKKAGNNYIMEVGKLLAKRQKIDESDRNRTIDVYLPCPMTYNWAINIAIPKGYTVKGVEELNKQINNDTGSFSSVATNDGQFVNIKISEVFIHNFEKASNWPKLLEIIDALESMITQKILLEKSKS